MLTVTVERGGIGKQEKADAIVQLVLGDAFDADNLLGRDGLRRGKWSKQGKPGNRDQSLVHAAIHSRHSLEPIITTNPPPYVVSLGPRRAASMGKNS